MRVMAFRGKRGSSRGRGLIVGSSRGRGTFTSGSRGRGRGRGGTRGGKGKPIFDGARVTENKDGHQTGKDDDSSEDDEDEVVTESDSGENDDVVEASVVRPYTALLQILAVDSAPQAKRRRLESSMEQDPGERKSGDIFLLQHKHDVDQVEEDEEGPEAVVDGVFEDEDEVNEIDDSSDPFEVRFANPNDNLLSTSLKALEKRQWATRKQFFPKVGRAIISFPGDTGGSGPHMPVAIPSPTGLRLKQRLADSLAKQTAVFGPLEQSLAPFLFNYSDVLFSERNPANSEPLRRLTCLHAINHIFKTRDRVIKNNARLSKEDSNDHLDLRDQGFTRPKVLMLLPTRQSCVRMVDTITLLCEPEQQENRKRFDESYVQKVDNFSIDKPEDFRELFGGNDDDMFRLGMKFTRKTLKFFSQFYNSDVIMASPLGLRMAIGTEEEQKVDSDFLSSIELVIVDQADSLLMQNWEHVEFIFEHLNLQPKEAHGCDFSRVRSWYLENNAKHFRQTVALTAFNTPELNTIFYNRSQNWSGRVKIIANYPGAIQELGLKAKQTFSRLESPSFSTDPNTRFTYFATAIIPSLTRYPKDSAGTLIFIPSYLDFVRVRNYFSTSASTSKLSFGSISEYTSVSDVARARSHFLTGRHNVLLYTERAHHFRRYQLKGVRKVIMYGLPDNPIFYKEIVGGCLGRTVQEGKLEPGEGSVRVIFSKWDVLKLERVAGTERIGKMIKDKGDTFDFL